MITKANQFLSFDFGDLQLLDNLISIGGATRLDSILKAYKTSETENCFPNEWFDDPEKLNKTHFRPYETFFSKTRNTIPLENDQSDFQSLEEGGLISEEVLLKIIEELRQPPPIEQKKLSILDQCVPTRKHVHLQRLFCAGMTTRT